MSADRIRQQKFMKQPGTRLHKQEDVLRVTRAGGGQAVITADAAGRVTFLNPTAEFLTGWTCREAMGQPCDAVFRIVDEAGQRRLERSLAYADDIVETVREPLVVLDAELRVRMANHSFYQDFHVTPADTEDRFLFDLGDHQWDIPALRTLLGETILQNASFHDFEMAGSFPGLGRRTMLLNARRILGHGAHSGMVLLAIEDITERKLVEFAVRTSEVRYRRLFETAQDGIMILDCDTGKIIDSNPVVSDLLGYTADQLRGKELWEIGLFKDVDANRAAFRQLQESGRARHEDLPFETKDGRHACMEFVSNVYPVEGRPVVQCNVRNITDRKRAEDALKEAGRCKDEFLAVLAHELRNPLAPIRNAIQVMRLKRANDDVRSTCEVVERQVRQLARLVDDLLDISRVNSGTMNLQKEPLDMALVVARAVEMSRPVIDAHRHSLQVLLPAQSVRVDGDLGRLAQLLCNLLNNSAKYTADGGRIHLTVEEAGGEAVLRVRDTGVGIAADMLPHIFEMFAQVPGSISHSEGGLGIGLTLVRKLAELHGGRVEAHSAGPGDGAEFVVRLPLLREGWSK
jgi:PAS domain S-box-containing protein